MWLLLTSVALQWLCLHWAQNLLSPLSATDIMACVCVAVSETWMAQKKNLTVFSYISEFFLICTASQMELPVKQATNDTFFKTLILRSTPDRSPPPTQRSCVVFLFFLCLIRPQVCWPASAPPSTRAWMQTSRWSCCCWLCGCGCWGPPCRLETLWSWRCCVALPRWRERAAEKRRRECKREVRGQTLSTI